MNYTYDADGIRVSKSVEGVVTNYLVDKNRDYAQVLEERDAGAGLMASYVYGDDLINMNRGGVESFYHYDGNGNTRQLTDALENITDTYIYDAFGIILDRTGTTENDYLYTGEQYDANIGFYYLRARYYNPAIGRFITIDLFKGSIFDPMSLHKYLYSHANPIMNIDPSGMYTFSLVGMLVVSTIIGILASITAGIVQYARGKTEREIQKAMLTWFFIGFGAGMLVYSAAWLYAYLAATTATTAVGMGAGTIQQILNNTQRLMHAFHRHWQGILQHWNDLKPIINHVLSRPKIVQEGIRLGSDTATVYVSQTQVAGVTQWVTVAIYETGPLAGQLATVVIPTAEQLARAGIP